MKQYEYNLKSTIKTYYGNIIVDFIALGNSIVHNDFGDKIKAFYRRFLSGDNKYGFPMRVILLYYYRN